VNQLIANDTDFAYWPLVGFHTDRGGNGWALLHWDAAGNRMGVNDGDDWRAGAWNRLVGAPSRTGQIPQETRWNMLLKESCPQNEKLVGISHTGNRGLCVSGPQWSSTTRVTNEQHVTNDWASGYTKLQCPAGNAAVGYANFTLVCAPVAQGTQTRVLWFDRGDNRPDQGGDWANGHYKGQCAQDEHIAGVAYNWRRTPDALLCRK
jgi:hypothetical protein